jgi:hypothetical protein
MIALARPGKTSEIGDRLEDLVSEMLQSIDGVMVEARKSLNAAGSEETDLWIRHRAHLSGLPFTDFIVPIECKNEDTRAASEDVTRLASKIVHSGGTDGLLVARAGLAGPGPFKTAHSEIHLELARQVKIVVLVGADLPALKSPDDLVDLIVNRHTELRIKGTYESI